MTKEMYEDLLERNRLQISELNTLTEEQDKHIAELEKENAELSKKIEILKKSYRKQRNKRIDELQKENAEMKRDFMICEKNADTYYDLFAKAKEIIEGLMRFCRCFAQHHTEDIRYQEAEQFLSEVEK